MQYQVLFFDIDDTIFDYKKCSEEAMHNTCRFLGVPYTEKLMNYFRKLDDELWADQKKGTLTVAQVIRKRADKMMIMMGILDTKVDFAVIFGDALGETTQLVDGIDQLQLNRLKKAGLLHYFKDVYVSDEIGCEKPDKQFFLYCLKMCGDYSETDVLMIGDSLTADIKGALDSGWNAIWFNRNQLANPCCCSEFSNLKELLDLIG